jgi:uncharacterized membrane protein YqaE (UPF0057 family)
MSATLAFVLPFCAHFLGIFLKKGPFKQGVFTVDVLLTILATVVPMAVIVAIAYLRERYVEALGIQRVVSVVMDPRGVTLVFMAINLLIFLAATLASYFVHDPAIEKPQKELKAARKRLKRAQKALSAARGRFEQAEKRLQETKAQREKAFEEKKSEARGLKDFTQRMISVYRTHNLEARPDPTLPKSFKVFPQIKIPETLSDLDWECPGLAEEAQEPIQESRS